MEGAMNKKLVLSAIARILSNRIGRKVTLS